MSPYSSMGSLPLPQGFTVYQPALGSALQFLPALGTPELDSMINAYVAGPASLKDKRAAVCMEFFGHSRQTGETTLFFPVFAPTFPSVASDSPASLSDSGYGSGFNVSPVVPEMWGTPVSMNAPTTPSSVFAAPTNSRASNPNKAHSSRKASTAASSRASVSTTTDFSHIPGMKIMTKDGLDVTNSASRGCKTKEQRDHAHLMRIIKACDACRRKKIRCDPSHKKRSASQLQSPSEPKQAKKAKAATPSAAPQVPTPVSVDLSAAAQPPLQMAPAQPAPLDASATIDLVEELFDWEQFFRTEGDKITIPEDYDFYFDPEGLLTPTSGSSASPLQPFTPTTASLPAGLPADTLHSFGSSAGSPGLPGLESLTALSGLDGLAGIYGLEQLQLPYLSPGGLHDSNYVDFTLYSPASSFLDEEPQQMRTSDSGHLQRDPQYYERVSQPGGEITPGDQLESSPVNHSLLTGFPGDERVFRIESSSGTSSHHRRDDVTEPRASDPGAQRQQAAGLEGLSGRHDSPRDRGSLMGAADASSPLRSSERVRKFLGLNDAFAQREMAASAGTKSRGPSGGAYGRPDVHSQGLGLAVQTEKRALESTRTLAPPRPLTSSSSTQQPSDVSTQQPSDVSTQQSPVSQHNKSSSSRVASTTGASSALASSLSPSHSRYGKDELVSPTSTTTASLSLMTRGRPVRKHALPAHPSEPSRQLSGASLNDAGNQYVPKTGTKPTSLPPVHQTASSILRLRHKSPQLGSLHAFSPTDSSASGCNSGCSGLSRTAPTHTTVQQRKSSSLSIPQLRVSLPEVEINPIPVLQQQEQHISFFGPISMYGPQSAPLARRQNHRDAAVANHSLPSLITTAMVAVVLWTTTLLPIRQAQKGHAQMGGVQSIQLAKVALLAVLGLVSLSTVLACHNTTSTKGSSAAIQALTLGSLPILASLATGFSSLLLSPSYSESSSSPSRASHHQPAVVGPNARSTADGAIDNVKTPDGGPHRGLLARLEDLRCLAAGRISRGLRRWTATVRAP